LFRHFGETSSSQTARVPAGAIEIAATGLYHAVDDRRAAVLAGTVRMTGMDNPVLISHEVFSPDITGVRTCVLLAKRRDDLPDRGATHFTGFDVEDRFVVGHGLDYDGLYRNLPDICLPRCMAGRDGR